MKKTYTKNFEYEGQMINYYNKVAKNNKVEWCGRYTDKNGRYTVKWTYKA